MHARDIEWFMERNPDKSHGGATGFMAPTGVRVNQIPPTTDMGEMLVRGELDGALHYLPERNLVDRSRVDVSGVTRYLFPDPAAEGRRYFAKTGLFPINHTVVVRRSLLESHPWIALNLYSAFVAAKEEIARSGTRSCAGISRRACSMTMSGERSPPMIRWPTASRRRVRCSRPLRNTCMSKGSVRAASRSTSSSPRAPSTCERDCDASETHDPSP